MSPSGFEIFLLATILVLGFTALAWIHSQQEFNDSIQRYVKSQDESIELLSKALESLDNQTDRRLEQMRKGGGL